MKHRRGFTLVELIVVVIVLGVLLAIVVPKLLGSTNDSNAQLIAKSVKDIRDAVAMAKLKCLAAINNAAGGVGYDTQQLLDALSGDTCQILAKNAYNVENGFAKVKDFGIRTDYRNADNVLIVDIDCQGNNDICKKVKDQLNSMYGNGVCPDPNNGFLTCNLPI
jgi:prepilin-type N-terminal cleavage/methylation domain-containing protein